MRFSVIFRAVLLSTTSLACTKPPRNISYGKKNIVEKAVEKVVDAAEDVFDATKYVAKNAIDAFEDAAEFMGDCFSSVGDHNVVLDAIYVSGLKSQDVSSEGHNWMNQLDDSRTLQSLTIPGTHNTMTYGIGTGIKGIFWAQNQYASLTDQLNMWVRYLDVRLRHVGDDFPVYHGRFSTGRTFGWVLDVVTEFLQGNKNETVLISTQKEYEDKNPEGSFCEVFEHNINKTKYAGFLFSSYTKLPTLGEARGKIIFIDKQGCKGFYRGLYASEFNEYSLENEYLTTTYKKRLITHITQPEKDSKLSVTWCSGYIAQPGKCQLSSPLAVSRIVNPWLKEISQPKGVIMMDFPPADLIHYLYSQNIN